MVAERHVQPRQPRNIEEMKSMATNKGRILFLLKYLMDHTDELHGITTNEIIEICGRHGFSMTDKTVRDDTTALIEAGFPIIKTGSAGISNLYSYEQLFTEPELKLLIDTIAGLNLFSEEGRSQIIDKLRHFGGPSTPENPLTDPKREKSLYASANTVYYHIQMIQEAIGLGRKISYQYLDYNAKKEQILRNSGEVYIYSPYSFAWNEGVYYLLGEVGKRPGLINPIRVELMTNITILDEAITPPPPGFDPKEYAEKIFKMYNGRDASVILEADESLMKKFLERFGQDFTSWTVSKSRFRARVNVIVSPTFYAWVFQYAGRIRIIGPDDVRNEYAEMLNSLAADYK